MKNIATTILVVLLVTPSTHAESGCADCGAIVSPKLQCLPNCTKATAEVIEWGVVDDPVCITRCRLLSCLPFKSDCQDCDEFCSGGCDSSKSCMIRGRNRLMRKTLVEYIPVTDYVVAPICQGCLYERLESEPIPTPDGAPLLAPLIDAAAVQKNSAATARPVHWIYSDTAPTEVTSGTGVAEKWLERQDVASPLPALTLPRMSQGPIPTLPVQR